MLEEDSWRHRFVQIDLPDYPNEHPYKHIEALLNPNAKEILENNNISRVYYFYMCACMVKHYINRFLKHYRVTFGNKKLESFEAILLDCSLEGNFEVDEVMKTLCAELDADRRQLIVISQSRVLEGPQSTVFFNQAHYDIVSPKSRERIDTAINDKPNHLKTIICLNNKPSSHRIALVSYLVSKGLHLNNYVSFALLQDCKRQNLNNNTQTALLLFKSLNAEINAFITGYKPGDLVIPAPGDGKGNIFYSEGTPWSAFAGSRFSIVTESEFCAHPSPPEVRVTEKVYKSIAVGHPFILVGTAGSLQHLEELGFLTFTPFINEDYDISGSEDERMLRICRSIDLLLSDQNYHTENHEMLRRIGTYNQRHLMSGRLHQQVIKLYNSTLSEFFTYWRK